MPGGFTAETDVFDTWFTSSLTPQIATGWLLKPERHENLFPADIRPQSHEIIRTWAFYTVAKAMLHEAKTPWDHVLISGWILDPDRKKMSKSKGNVVTPVHLIDSYGADAVRYWAACARMGTDTAFDETVFKVGKRLVTKLYNAGKYVLSQSAEIHPITNELDRAFIARLRTLVDVATASFADFEFAPALDATERFFWSSFTDTYLELCKVRARGEAGNSDADRGSAVATLRLGLNVLLRLFAPILPFITDEVWRWAFAEETGKASVHQSSWPTVEELATIAVPECETTFELAEKAWFTINKKKSELGASVGRPLTRLSLAMNPATARDFRRVQTEIVTATRTHAFELIEKDDIAPGEFDIVDIEVEPKQPKAPTAE